MVSTDPTPGNDCKILGERYNPKPKYTMLSSPRSGFPPHSCCRRARPRNRSSHPHPQSTRPFQPARQTPFLAASCVHLISLCCLLIKGRSLAACACSPASSERGRRGHTLRHLSIIVHVYPHDPSALHGRALLQRRISSTKAPASTTSPISAKIKLETGEVVQRRPIPNQADYFGEGIIAWDGKLYRDDRSQVRESASSMTSTPSRPSARVLPTRDKAGLTPPTASRSIWRRRSTSIPHE